MIRLIPLFFVSLLIAPLVADAQVQERVSDITGVERFVSEDLRDVDLHSYLGDDIAFRAEHERNPMSGEEAWKLTFYGFANSSTDFSSASRVLVWIDGQRIRANDAESRTRRMDDSVMETVTAYFSPSQFERMANAEQLEFTIGSAEFDLSFAQRADMRSIMDMVANEPMQHQADNDD